MPYSDPKKKRAYMAQYNKKVYAETLMLSSPDRRATRSNFVRRNTIGW